MTLLKSVTSTITAIAATASRAAFLTAPPPLSSPAITNFQFSLSSTNSNFGLVKSFTSCSPLSSVLMDAPQATSPTEFMVDMKCEDCIEAVRRKLETLEGVKSVEVDLRNQVVRILGISPVKSMEEALEQTGRKARLLGQGVPEGINHKVAYRYHCGQEKTIKIPAEFKGASIFGIVYFAQANMELARIEANFSGLSPGKHGWSINEFGALTRGPSSTGKLYNPPIQDSEKEPPLGDLGTLEVNEKGKGYYSGVKKMLKIVDLIGRSMAVYETDEEKSDSGFTTAVIARSARGGENYKKLCTCDGTTIWEAKP